MPNGSGRSTGRKYVGRKLAGDSIPTRCHSSCARRHIHPAQPTKVEGQPVAIARQVSLAACGPSCWIYNIRGKSMTARSPSIAIKRVYESPAESDGLRLLVDRLWPRGLKKEQVRI